MKQGNCRPPCRAYFFRYHFYELQIVSPLTRKDKDALVDYSKIIPNLLCAITIGINYLLVNDANGACNRHFPGDIVATYNRMPCLITNNFGIVLECIMAIKEAQAPPPPQVKFSAEF